MAWGGGRQIRGGGVFFFQGIPMGGGVIFFQGIYFWGITVGGGHFF